MPTRTFWLEPTDRLRLGLRRYAPAADGPCGPTGCHDAVAWMRAEARATWTDNGRTLEQVDHWHPPDDDPRWPQQCATCGRPFDPTDPHQPWQELLYRRADTGQLVVLHSWHPPDVPTAPPGATWDAWWMGDSFRGPDGIALMVRCPRPGIVGAGADWPVDGPSSNGARWNRTGDPRRAEVTVSPSIAMGLPDEPGYYHGWLEQGWLT